MLEEKKFTAVCFVFVYTDDEPPIINSCPGDQHATTDNGSPTGTVSWTEPTATDNSGLVNVTSTHHPGDSFQIGTTTVTYMAIDPSSNVANCTFSVVVTGSFSNSEQSLTFSCIKKLAISRFSFVVKLSYS